MAEGQKGSGSNDNDAALWVIGVFLIIIAAVLYFKPHWVMKPWVAVKSAETAALQWIAPSGAQPTLAQIAVDLAATPTNQVPINTVATISREIGQIIKLPVAALLVTGGVIIVMRRRYQKRHDRDSLLDTLSREFPQTRLMTKHSPDKEMDPTAGPWASSVKPHEYAERHQLIDSDKVNRDRAAKTFSQQMGRPWRGVARLSEVERRVFAILTCRIAKDKAMADNLIKGFGLAYGEDIPFKDVDALADEAIRKYGAHPRIQELVKRHAFVRTILMRMLAEARSDGVMPSANLVWVKPNDRILWYCLNNVGRVTAWTECAGVMAHYAAEVVVKRALHDPCVVKAVDALEEYLRTTGVIATR